MNKKEVTSSKYNNSTYKLTRAEMELHITYSALDLEATVYTCIPKVTKILDQFCYSFPSIYYLIDQDQYSKTFKCPTEFIWFKKPRTLTVKQRKQKAENMKRIRNKKKDAS
jgi:hypothetical protein